MLAGIKRGKRKAPATKQIAQIANGDNVSAADQLRSSLSAGVSDPLPKRASEASMEARGRIQRSHDKTQESDSQVVVLENDKIFRKNEIDLTISEMVHQERHSTGTDDEVKTFLRNTKRHRKLLKDDKKDDYDDAQIQQYRELSTNQGKYEERIVRREQQRQVARHDQLQAYTKRCWWWLDAPTFDRRKLLALGDHVSMVWTPSARSIGASRHFYLVPIKHASSLVQCDQEVWNELDRFQAALRGMYPDQSLICTETVLPSKQSFWQTKLEVMLVPKTVAQDSPLYFQSALQQQAEEWGTHQKVMDTTIKGLRRTVPSQFPYVYLQYDTNSKKNRTGGCAQIIESDRFPVEFAIDTVLGMMVEDPLRFRKKKTDGTTGEQQHIREFLNKWKQFDWTVELDDIKK